MGIVLPLIEAARAADAEDGPVAEAAAAEASAACSFALESRSLTRLIWRKRSFHGETYSRFVSTLDCT